MLKYAVSLGPPENRCPCDSGARGARHSRIKQIAGYTNKMLKYAVSLGPPENRCPCDSGARGARTLRGREEEHAESPCDFPVPLTPGSPSACGKLRRADPPPRRMPC
ncbi:hypothetical protein QE152_g6997 [Popillia japonica]|uniref:Uncharacterized protein n=1 Tax=Popillia japonica TaxID=7064 RepID=A0AAW1MHA9_POPJA